MVALTFADILKFNPYHDERGRFSTADAATLFTIRTRDPNKQYLANEGIRREKERDAAEAAAASAVFRDSPQLKAVRDIEDDIRNRDIEFAGCVDKDGNVLFFKQGDKNSVGFTLEEKLQAFGNVLTHNHPSSSMFSPEDIGFWLGHGLDEIRATNRLGITYCIKRGEKFTAAKGEEFYRHYNDYRSKALSDAGSQLDKNGTSWKLNHGQISYDEANDEYNRLFAVNLADICSKVAPRYGMEFYVEKREVGKSAGTEYTAKAADGGEIVVTLDKEHEEVIAAAFKEWADRAMAMKEEPTEKSDTINSAEQEFSVYKTDDSKRLVFGWASISLTADGEQLEDLQHDIINPEDLEEAVYEYVLNFRDTGEEHRPHLRKKGKLVESCVFTPEKQRAMGLPEGILPVGWWIGFYIEDDEAWEKVKNGTYKMFSIEGKANRVPVEKAAPEEKEGTDRYDHIQEFDDP